MARAFRQLLTHRLQHLRTSVRDRGGSLALREVQGSVRTPWEIVMRRAEIPVSRRLRNRRTRRPDPRPHHDAFIDGSLEPEGRSRNVPHGRKPPHQRRRRGASGLQREIVRVGREHRAQRNLGHDHVGMRIDQPKHRRPPTAFDTGDGHACRRDDRCRRDALDRTIDDQNVGRRRKTGARAVEDPEWDPVSQKRVREALIALSNTIPDLRYAAGPDKDSVDPVRRIAAAASGWGLNPDQDAIYLNVFPDRNDGKTPYRLTVKDVPVDAFWSVTAYTADGYFNPNELNA